MTTIITDGKSMAADRMAVSYGREMGICKITRVGDELIGVAGCYAFGVRLIDWYKAGADIKDIPAADGTNYDMIIISKTKGIRALFKHGLAPINMGYYAIGSGCDFALSAALFGKTLHEAIEFAASQCHDTGLGVDVMGLG